jgi:hypothetical protein
VWVSLDSGGGASSSRRPYGREFKGALGSGCGCPVRTCAGRPTPGAVAAARGAAAASPGVAGPRLLEAEFEVGRLRRGGDIVCAAKSRDQAKLVFDAAKIMVKRSPDLRSPVRIYKTALEYKGGVLTTLSYDSHIAMGLNPSLVLCDELHVWQGESGRGAKPVPFEERASPVSLAPGVEPRSYSEARRFSGTKYVWCWGASKRPGTLLECVPSNLRVGGSSLAARDDSLAPSRCCAEDLSHSSDRAALADAGVASAASGAAIRLPLRAGPLVEDTLGQNSECALRIYSITEYLPGAWRAISRPSGSRPRNSTPMKK